MKARVHVVDKRQEIILKAGIMIFTGWGVNTRKRHFRKYFHWQIYKQIHTLHIIMVQKYWICFKKKQQSVKD